MRIGLLLSVVGAIVTAAAAVADDGVLPNEDPSEDMGILIFESESPHDERAEESLFRQGCSNDKACRRKKGTCITSSETCNGTVISRGCGLSCTCCIKEPEVCERRGTCKQANGFCVKDSGSCTGSIIPDGCTGKDCICCVNDNNCPNGFYRVGIECFKVYQQFAGWDEARHICRSHGWDLAEPEDLPALAEFMYTKVSHYYFWIGGRGIGGSFKYLSGESLSDNAPWGLGYPGDITSVGDCLILQSTNTSYMTSLASNDCYSKYYFLCEPACPKGFIKSGSGCFKEFVKLQKWEDAEKNCYYEGLRLAEPENPKGLAKSLYEGIGGTKYTNNRFWIGARGGRINGSTFAWNSGDPVDIPYDSNNNAWYTGYPRYYTSGHCLQLYTRYHIAGPMYELGCGYAYQSLCELICPLGFFHIGNQCYKPYSSSASSWAEAREMCNQAHLTLAEPQDPTAVAHYLFTVTGDRNYWLGGRGDGKSFRWSSGDAIPNTWAPWRPGKPGNKVGRDYCLRLAPEHSTTPLTSTTCSKKFYPLCQ